MRIHTKTIFEWQGEELRVLHEEGYEYFGPLDMAKGDSTAKATEQSQANFNNSLQSIFQQQYATQSAQLKYLQTQLEPMISNPTGYSDAELTAMRTSATDTLSTQYQNARAALGEQESVASGGSKLTGLAGATVQENAALLNSEAQAKAGAQESITTQNANLKQANYWNAISALSGVSGMANPLGYAGASTNAANSVTGLSQAVTSANQSQLLGALGGIAGGVGTALAGPLGKVGCWVAASFWGWDDIRTWIIRMWMLTKAPAWFRNLYLKHGEWIASTPLRWAYFPIFEAVLNG